MRWLLDPSWLIGKWIPLNASSVDDWSAARCTAEVPDDRGRLSQAAPTGPVAECGPLQGSQMGEGQPTTRVGSTRPGVQALYFHHPPLVLEITWRSL